MSGILRVVTLLTLTLAIAACSRTADPQPPTNGDGIGQSQEG